MSKKSWLFIATLLFVIGLVSGLVAPIGVARFLSEDIAAFADLANRLATLPKLTVFAIIFIKNVSAVLVSFLLSPFLCLAPILALTFNGWFIGWVSARVIEETSVGYLLLGLLPHGIFELPGLVVGEAAALSFGSGVLLALFRKKGGKAVLPNLRQNLKYLTVSIFLFLPAAIIETYVTPLLLR